MKISDAKLVCADFRIACNRDCLKNTLFKSLWLNRLFFQNKAHFGQLPIKSADC